MPKIRWTVEVIAAEALKYSTRSAFKSSSYGAYQAARNRGILDHICAHMILAGNLHRRQVYNIFSMDGLTVYIGIGMRAEKRFREHTANKNPAIRTLLNSPHFVTVTPVLPAGEAARSEINQIKLFREQGFNVLNKSDGGGLGGGGALVWTDKKIAAEALKHQTRKTFKCGNYGAYIAAWKRGILDQVCAHMTAVRQTHTDASITAEALKYETRWAFQRGSNAAYHAAWRRGLLDQVCAHMLTIR